MRITIVTGPFYSLPPAPCGGVEILWHGLARRFAAAGHSVTMVCRGYPGLPADETLEGVRFLRRTRMTRSGRLPLSLAKDMAYSLRLVPTLPPADILTTNVFWLPAFVQRFRRGVGKLIINVHRFPKRQLRLYGSVDRVATCSTVIEKAIGEQAPELLARTRVFKNPIDIDVFSPPPVARGARRPITILYTGRVHPEKGLTLLAEAFGRLHRTMPETRLKILGPSRVEQGGGGEAFVHSLRAAAASAPVEIAEPIYDRAQLAEAYRSADCYCYPSTAEKGEALPAAPLEAMATGLAPVVSNLDCFRDYLRPGVNGHVFDHRSADPVQRLCESLHAALANPERSAEMGLAGVRTAADYSYEKVAYSYIEDFQRLLGTPRGAK